MATIGQHRTSRTPRNSDKFATMFDQSLLAAGLYHLRDHEDICDGKIFLVGGSYLDERHAIAVMLNVYLLMLDTNSPLNVLFVCLFAHIC